MNMTVPLSIRQWVDRRRLQRLRLLGRPLSAFCFGRQLGLVLSEQSLRLCLMDRSWGRFRVIDVGTIPFAAGDAADWPKRCLYAAQVIVEYLNRWKASHVPVNIGLLSHEIGFRRLTLPDMPARELAEAVTWEGGKLFPFDFSKCTVYFEAVRRFMRENTRYLDLNIIAVDNSIVRAVYNQFQAAGLTLGQVNYLPCFLERLSSAPSLASPEGRELVLYLDDEQSMAIFTHDGHLEFHQSFATRPLPGPLEDGSLENVEAIADELTTFIDLYNAQDRENSPRSITICGRYGTHPDTEEFFSGLTGLPCRSAAGLDWLEAMRGQCDAAAVNTAMAPFLVSLAPTYRYPLAPAEYRAAKAKSLIIKRVGTAAAVAALGITSLWYADHQTGKNLTHELMALQSERAEMEKSLGFRTYRMVMSRLNQDQSKRLDGVNTPPSIVHVLFKELSLTLPEQLTITAIDVRQEEGKYRLALDGVISLAGFSPEIVLAQYVTTLEQSPLFTGVAVVNYRKEAKKDAYDLTFQLAMDLQV